MAPPKKVVKKLVAKTTITPKTKTVAHKNLKARSKRTDVVDAEPKLMPIKGKSVVPKTVADLKGASYNPRYITAKQLTSLQNSMERFGDLSGVVFNIRSGVLISGHQRMKTTKGLKTRLVKTKQAKDVHGTVAVGHIEVQPKDGSATIRIPYREVEWDDKLQEMAANVAANAAGGEFDQAKLGKILQHLERGQFDIELTSIDTWNMSKAIGKFKKSKTEGDAGSGSGSDAGGDDDSGSEGFQSIDPKAMKFDHKCPKCNYRF